MSTPSEKSPEIEKTLDAVTEQWNGRKRTDSTKQDICVYCGKPATEFRNNISRKEYTISGLCQQCQDEVFGGD